MAQSGQLSCMKLLKLLGLNEKPETLDLRTVRQDVLHVQGASVNFAMSPADKSSDRYRVLSAFTAADLNFMEHSCPLQLLQQHYPHLRGLPLPSLHKIQPLVLIGSSTSDFSSPFSHHWFPKSSRCSLYCLRLGCAGSYCPYNTCHQPTMSSHNFPFSL